jgi:hypothetical protein
VSSSFVQSTSETFTVTHARYLASKVATDLQRFQRFYGKPSNEWIAAYEGELIHLLKHDLLDNVVYGFQRATRWTAAVVKYTVGPKGVLVTDDDPGKLTPGLDVAGAEFTSYLCHKPRWLSMSNEERARIEQELPFRRIGKDQPGLESGYWLDDRRYSAGGVALGRSTVKR